jgi:hypothetical protein
LVLTARAAGAELVSVLIVSTFALFQGTKYRITESENGKGDIWHVELNTIPAARLPGISWNGAEHWWCLQHRQ